MKIDASSCDLAIQRIADLVGFDTSPGHATTPLLDYVESVLSAYGATSRRLALDHGRHGVLVARLGPCAPGGIVLSGHVDVVSTQDQTWTSDPFRLRQADGRLYGRGACDMKGFIGCALALAPHWQQANLQRPFYLALSCDEEQENLTVLNVIDLLKAQDEQAAAAAAVVVGEPTSMDVVAAHKGTLAFTIEILGKAAHSSHPENGINALLIASDIVVFFRALEEELRSLSRDERFNPPYCTINLGQLHGGTAPNIVASQCSLVLQLRHLKTSQATLVRQRLAALLDELQTQRYPGSRLTCQATELPPLEFETDNPAIVLAQRALNSQRLETAAYATEAGLFQQAGFPTVVCGPGDIAQAHGADEYLSLDQVKTCLRFLMALSA